MQSIVFGSNPSRVELPAAAPINNLSAWSAVFWHYSTDATGSQDLMSKGHGSDSGRKSVEASGGAVAVTVNRAGGNDLRIGNGAYSVNGWSCIGVTYDPAGATIADRLKVYRGTLTTAMAEVSSYNAFTLTGSGAVQADAAWNLIFGNRRQFDEVLKGRMAFAAYYGVKLSLAQLEAIRAETATEQFTPGAGLVYGAWMNTLGTPTDLSGNGGVASVIGCSLGDGLLGPPPPPQAQLVTVSDPNWFFSPYNTYKSGSAFASWNNAGAYFKCKVSVFGGPGLVRLKLDTSSLAGIPADKCPIVLWTVDDGPAVAAQAQLSYSASPTYLTLANGLPAGEHAIELYAKAFDFTGVYDRWVTPAQQVKILGLEIDATAAMAQPTIRPKRILFYGASHFEGADLLGECVPPTQGLGALGWDPTQTDAALIAHAFDAEYGVVAFCGQGFVNGIDRVPATTARPSLKNADPAKESWDKYCASQSRLVAGAFSPTPDMIVIGTGTNDAEIPLTAPPVTAALDAIRAAAGPNPWIFLTTDVAGSQSAALDAGAAAAAVQTRLVRIKPEVLVVTSNGLYATQQTWNGWDSARNGAHPNARGHAKHAVEEVRAMVEAMNAG